ncbi:hypothetical protein J6590_071687 [Homalodisca vitripennis]|nr:hypothetical protein J6590_071687 [Homalodisca vitripennis]
MNTARNSDCGRTKRSVTRRKKCRERSRLSICDKARGAGTRRGSGTQNTSLPSPYNCVLTGEISVNPPGLGSPRILNNELLWPRDLLKHFYHTTDYKILLYYDLYRFGRFRQIVVGTLTHTSWTADSRRIPYTLSPPPSTASATPCLNNPLSRSCRGPATVILALPSCIP